MAKEVKVDHLHKLTIKFVNSYYFSQTYGDDSYNDSNYDDDNDDDEMNEVQVLKVTPPQSKPCSNNAFVALAESSDSEFETSDNEAKKKHKSKTEAKEVCQSQKAMKLAPIFTKTPSKSNEKCTGTSVVDKDMTMTNASTVTPAGNSTPPRRNHSQTPTQKAIAKSITNSKISKKVQSKQQAMANPILHPNPPIICGQVHFFCGKMEMDKSQHPLAELLKRTKELFIIFKKICPNFIWYLFTDIDDFTEAISTTAEQILELLLLLSQYLDGIHHGKGNNITIWFEMKCGFSIPVESFLANANNMVETNCTVTSMTKPFNMPTPKRPT
jgi:hypothetical protein